MSEAGLNAKERAEWSKELGESSLVEWRFYWRIGLLTA